MFLNIKKISPNNSFQSILAVFPISFPTPGTVVKVGGTSKGVTVRKDIIKRFNLKSGYNLQIDFQKETTT